MSRKSTGAKIQRELKRRMERIAQGLPVTETYSDKRPPTKRWARAEWDRTGRRVFKLVCGCKKEHTIHLLYSSRSIYWREIQPWSKAAVKRETKRRRKKADYIQRNLQKGDLTKLKLEEFLNEYEYEPEENKDDKSRSSRG